MCTLTFLPWPEGFALAMNRDEQYSRPAALAPERHSSGSGFAIYPREPNGGTWIGLHEKGHALALMNWNAHPIHPGCTSRGRIIPHLLACSQNRPLAEHLEAIDLRKTNPFRLVSVDPASREIREFRWDGVTSSSVGHFWKLSHWFSSAFDEERVSMVRAAVAFQAASQPDSGSLPWARRLHSSHQPSRGPYSICMHRADAETVSLTEVEYGPGKLECRYYPGSPCRAGFGFGEGLGGMPPENDGVPAVR